ncbi:lariat debranching enzyme [Danaus plexippus plexippus]|uniref:Lariat debranching enzyme n=1 Tax=Danaus plexippus plexippus TaxID=278856 RepID=A0A212EL36_DANPL|nr:lariat debranching enzyme [Danaus plexippus plexippus]
MKIAIEGCAHGELDKIYECVETLQRREGINVDLLICCGDFQSVRNNDDLRAMAVPEKYQNICTFYKYYSGEKIAPVLTLFIGGNHEASNYLQELPYGGWVAPNIYFLGRAGVVQFGNLRIGGLSGIFKGHDYLQGLWECPPYTPGSLRSVYHIRSLDVFRLSQMKENIHIMLSHDWPRGITSYGDKENLLRRKPFLRDDIESNQLGSPPAEKLLHTLKPQYWFAAHLHCQFAAVINHDNNRETKFLALDKCLPRRRHLQILDLATEYDGDKTLKYDPEWLAILRNTNHLLSVKNVDCHLPGPGGDERYDFTPSEEEKNAILSLLDTLIITNDSFVKTAPVYRPGAPKCQPTEPVLNPQTAYLCEKLGIDDPIQVIIARSGRTIRHVQIENNQNEEKDDIIEQTPFKCSKLSLPAPITPSGNDEDASRETLACTPENSFLSISNTSDCITPPSATKKVFKRRNLAIYTPEEEPESDSSSSFMSTQSPRSSKIFCKNDL